MNKINPTLQANERRAAINYQTAAASLREANRTNREAINAANDVLEAEARKYNMARAAYLTARETLDASRFTSRTFDYAVETAEAKASRG